MSDMSKAHALAQIGPLLQRGDTLHIILRTHSRRSNAIVDFVIPPTLHIGAYVGAILDRPYLYTYRGVLLSKGQQPELLVQAVSRELFGEPNQLKAVWL